jgi:hypothetical protein
MRDISGYYLLAAVLIATAVSAYWAKPERRAAVFKRPRKLFGLLTLIAAGLGLCLWSVTLERSEYTFERQSSPIAIAIAFDLSPSMLAIPNPEFDGKHPPRFERGKAVLLKFIRALEERDEPVIVSVVGFTKNASIIMGWDQSTAQVREILDYAVSPDLFGSSGTSIEAAAKSLDGVFAMLPDELRTTSRQLAIIVSDGEDTMRESSFDYAKQDLADSDFDTIALQTGLLDKNEGVPTYGRVGEFTGFRSMSGNTYTVPDFAAMSAIAESSSGRGLHVRAESQTAVDRMLQFTVGGDTGKAAPDAMLLSTFGMFAVVSLLCAVILR